MTSQALWDLIRVVCILGAHAFAVLTVVDPAITGFNEDRRREMLSYYREGQMNDEILVMTLRVTSGGIAIVTFILLLATLLHIG